MFTRKSVCSIFRCGRCDGEDLIMIKVSKLAVLSTSFAPRDVAGRFALMEVLRMDAELDEIKKKKSTMKEFKEVAMTKGFMPIQEDAARWVVDGYTSLEEVTRVIDLTGRLV